MQKIINSVDRVVSTCGSILLLFMTLIIGLQVIMRYIFNNSLTWPEELTRYCYLWCSMCGIAIVERQSGHLKIEVLHKICNDKMKKVLDMISSLMNIIFYSIFIYLGIPMVQLVADMDQYAISFNLPMVVVWVVFPLLGVATLVFASANIKRLFVEQPEE